MRSGLTGRRGQGLVRLIHVPLLLGTLVQARCPEFANDKIQYCVQPVAEYAKVLNQNDTQPRDHGSQFGNALQLPKLGGQVFTELCRLIRDFEVCVSDFREPCPKHITINLIEASYGFLCNEGYETFMNSAECLMELDQQPAVKRCHDETLKDIERANSRANIKMDTKLDLMCGALNYFSACVRRHIWLSCGVEAWHVIFRVLKDTTRTLIPTCHFDGESAKLDAERLAEPEPSPASPTLATSTARPRAPPARLEQLDQAEQVELRSAGQVRGSAISFEIHEELDQLAGPTSKYAHLGSGSYTSGSQLQISLFFVLVLLSIRQ